MAGALSKPNPKWKYRGALNTVASAVWHVPGRFGIARMFGGSYSLRCVVFHDVAAMESNFTRGMGVSIAPSQFKIAVEFLAKYYNPVSLQDVLDHQCGRSLPSRAVLVTFDDGYASLMETAIPACKRFGLPAVLFLNAAYLDNQHLSADNLVCYVANTLGLESINAAARAVVGDRVARLETLMEVFRSFFPSISLPEREAFLRSLIHLAGIDERQLASETRLYLNAKQVRDLASSGFEIGNHTRSHVHCRCLTAQDSCDEIDRNKAELEALSAKPVRSFSVPYGSSADLSAAVQQHLRRTGHQAIFLSQAVANPCRADRFCIDRVGTRARNNDTLFLDLELLPRLRKIRDWIGRRNIAGEWPVLQAKY